MMTREEAEKELIAMLEEAEGGPSYSMEEVDAYMRELLHPKNQIYLTGDTHGRFERIISFCERRHLLLDGEKGEHAHFLRKEDIYP